MTATYDNTLPTPKDKARNILGDIDAANALRQDEEYNSQISLFGYDQAIVNMARSLAAEYSQQPVSFSGGGISVNWSERVKTWLAIADAYAVNVKQVKNTIKVAIARRAHDHHYVDCEYKRY